MIKAEVYTNNKIKDNKNMTKKKIKYISLVFIILSIMCIVFIDMKENGEDNLKGDIIKNLHQKYGENPKIELILNNIDLYPKELLELASTNEEAIDFVSDYIYNSKTRKEKNISIEKDYNKGEIPLFIQWDKRWGYNKYGSSFMATNGCGPTSLSMVAVGLTGNTKFNPKMVADFSYKNGYLDDRVGTKWSLMTNGAQHFGLNGKELPLDKDVIISTLKKGQPIIVSMGPGEFTTKGHFMVLTGVDNNKIIVNDPNSIEKSSKTWDIDVFMKEAKNLWTFTVI